MTHSKVERRRRISASTTKRSWIKTRFENVSSDFIYYSLSIRISALRIADPARHGVCAERDDLEI